MSDNSIETIEKYIKKELQLERMSLFSDEVFAIVITLMAIELRVPESEHKLTDEQWTPIFKHLFSVFMAYVVSFGFIGMIWYRHLKLFSFLKDYDGGLVLRNMLLLFFIGLFPFSASVVTTRSASPIIPFSIYGTVIVLCIAAQYALQYYVVVQRPNLRNHHSVAKQLVNLKLSRIILIGLPATFILAAVSYQLLQPEDKPMAFCWFLPFALIVRLSRRKYSARLKQISIVEAKAEPAIA